MRSVDLLGAAVTDSDLTVSILREIRDAIVKTNARLDETNIRLDETNTRLDKGFTGVVAILKHHDKRFAGMEDKLDELKVEVVFLGRYLKNRVEKDLRQLREKELRALRARVAKLERKVG